VLSIPIQAQRQNTLAQGDFGQWMVKHIDNWFAFAQRLGLGIAQMEEIVLVTGYDCTRSSMNVAFMEGEGDARALFGVQAVDGPDEWIRWRFSPDRVRGALLNQGPQGKVRRYFTLPRTAKLKKPWHDLGFRTYPIINASFFEGIASPELSGSYQSI
jgi:hypothetical protein